MTEWRCIPSCPQYEASDDGQVRRLGGRALAQHPGNRLGYLKVALWLDGHVAQRWLNRLVCEAFHGAPPSPDHEAAHSSGGAKIKKGALAPLALEYGVAERTLRDIASFRRWRHI